MQYKNYCDSKQIGDNLVAPKKKRKKKKVQYKHISLIAGFFKNGNFDFREGFGNHRVTPLTSKSVANSLMSHFQLA